jgi:hypothetical protein
MRNHHLPNRPALVAAVVLAAATASALLLIASHVADARSTTKPRTHKADGHGQLRGVAAAAGGFAVLERAPSAGDQTNAAIVELAKHADGLEPARARRLSSDSAGTLWLVPAGSQLCLVDVTAPNSQGVTSVMTCDDNARAATRGLLGVSVTGLYGAAPDGIARVTVRGLDGSADVMTPTGNAYRGPMPKSVDSVELAGPAGATSYSIWA